MEIVDLNLAEQKMLDEFAPNQWFLKHHWPENRSRVRRIISTLLANYADGNATVLDIGCFNGYISLLARLVGFDVTGSDAFGFPDRDIIFEKYGIHFLRANLNDRCPFGEVSASSFDAVIFAEIFEHILNHPLGVLREIARSLKPGGMLILTTPNPSTLANALRTISDRHTLWGTKAFAEVPKFQADGAICQADIHYREYRTSELCDLLAKAGFTVRSVRYMGMGSPVGEKFPKRLAKRCSGFLLQRRPFANTQFIVATKA